MITELPNERQPILMVEDSEDDFDAAKRAFKKVNLLNPIKHVNSSQEALEYLKSDKNRKPGLILMDLNMPGIDGRKTLDIIKQDKTLSQIPVVILTTSNDERDIQVCYELGANTYIQKPVDFDSLVYAAQQLKEYWFETAILPRVNV
jgi:two-component system response regulator